MPRDAELNEFLEAAGLSLGQAQRSILGGEARPPAVVLSEAELEIRAGFRLGDRGLHIEPVGSEEAAKGTLQSGALSTLKVRFVAARSEEGANEPVRSRKDVVDAVTARSDVKRLSDLLGEVRVETAFVGEMGIWTAQVRDTQGTLLRQITLPDQG